MIMAKLRARSVGKYSCRSNHQKVYMAAGDCIPINRADGEPLLASPITLAKLLAGAVSKGLFTSADGSREVELLRSYWALWYWRAAKGYALSTRLRGNASVVGHHTRVGGRGIYIGCGHRSRPGAGVVEELFGPDVWPAP